MRLQAGFTSLLLCLQFASGGTGGKPASGPYAGLKLVPAAGVKTMGDVSVQPDGKVVSMTTVAKLAGSRILDSRDSVLMEIAADGSVTGAVVGKKLRFNAADELLGENGARVLHLAPDGTPMLEMGGKAGPLPFKVEGVDARNRRMAVLLALFLYAPIGSGPESDLPTGSGARQAVPGK